MLDWRRGGVDVPCIASWPPHQQHRRRTCFVLMELQWSNSYQVVTIMACLKDEFMLESDLEKSYRACGRSVRSFDVEKYNVMHLYMYMVSLHRSPRILEIERNMKSIAAISPSNGSVYTQAVGAIPSRRKMMISSPRFFSCDLRDLPCVDHTVRRTVTNLTCCV